ncbi:NAD-binding Rossmann fold oxidoreductase [Amanita rubescens]|nr:NAD-binding Rossmann fold oxidoreductase [Amanita rubescens]
MESTRLPMPSLPIKVGFVGLSAKGGWASVTHGPAISSLSDEYTLTAISTSSSESASQTADKFSKSTGHPIKAYHGNTDGIASDPDVELVAVAALPAISAGKHIFLEWPAGASLAETTELAEAARKQGIRSVVGLQSRQSGSLKKCLAKVAIWGPQVHESRTYIHDPKAGTSITSVLQTLGDFEYVSTTAEIVYPTAKVIGKSSYPGGNDKVAKEIDDAIQVTSPDHVAVTGKFKSGAIASIMLRGGIKTTEGRRCFLWEIDGEDGSILRPGIFGIHACSVYLNGKLVQEPQAGEMLMSITTAWAEFAKDNGNYPTLDDAVKLHRLLEDVKQSAVEGRRIYVQ